MNTRELLVMGGTGVLGRRVVGRLDAAGVGARVMSRSGRPGTARGTCSRARGWTRRSGGWRRSSTAPRARTARPVRWTSGARDDCWRPPPGPASRTYFVYISIVGVDRAPSYPYYKAKLDAEGVVESSAVPHTILRATQFYDLVLSALRLLERSPVMVVPKGLPGQPIDVGEVADRLVELALAGPSGRVPDIGGPEVRTLTDATRSYLDATGRRRRIFELPPPGKTARAIRAGALTCPENTYGEKTWEDFLREKAVGRPGR